MNRILIKEITKRSTLRNKFLKSKSEANKKHCVKQRNYCMSLLRKTEDEYYGNLDPKKAADNRNIWTTIKPFISNKSIQMEKLFW